MTFPLILQTIITAQMTSIGAEGNNDSNIHSAEPISCAQVNERRRQGSRIQGAPKIE